jgi:hypothetical protein
MYLRMDVGVSFILSCTEAACEMYTVYLSLQSCSYSLQRNVQLRLIARLAYTTSFNAITDLRSRSSEM